MKNKPAKPITVGELIELLKTVDPKMLVALSCDSEGNGFSPIPDQLFYSTGYIENRLGDVDYEDEAFGPNTVPAIILWPSN